MAVSILGAFFSTSDWDCDTCREVLVGTWFCHAHCLATAKAVPCDSQAPSLLFPRRV